MKKEIEISQSKIKTWRNCRNAYFYKYKMKISKKFKPMPFLRGEIVHDMLEAHYKGNDPWKQFDRQLKANERNLRLNPEAYGHLPGLIEDMMKGYFKFYKKEKIKILAVEHEFRVRLVENIFIVGKIDLVARINNLNWISDHKCTNTMPSGGVVPYNNLQSASYVWAMNKENPKRTLDGIMWNYILGKPPSVPHLLKSGEMSRKASQTITWPLYRTALREAGLKPKDYYDVKEKLAGNEDNFYQRKFIPIQGPLISNIMEETKITALEMKEKGFEDRTRNLNFNCDRCEYKSLCVAQLRGLDDKFILKTEFKERKKNEKKIKKRKKL